MTIALKLPQILSTLTNLQNIQFEDQPVIIGKNGGKVGVIIKEMLNWCYSSESFANDFCSKMNLTKDQYDRLLDDVFEEFDSRSSKIIFRRVYAKKICSQK